MRARLPSPTWFALGLAAVVPALLLSTRATAEAPPAATTAPSTSAAEGLPSASVSASASASAPPPLAKLSDRLASEPLPDKPTPAPKSWKGVEQLSLESGNAGCDVQRVREWLHVRCDAGSVIDVSLLAGDANGVALAMPGEDFNVSADIVVPLRPGRDLIVSVTSAQFGRYSSGLPESVGLLWVLWKEESTVPIVRLE